MSIILVTGAAGSIGFHVSLRLLQRGDTVVGLENRNEYFDDIAKRETLRRTWTHAAFSFIAPDRSDRDGTSQPFALSALSGS